MRETITPTKGQSSTPKMRTTQLYQFISIYLIIFKSLTCIETKWKFKLGILTKIESKPTQQIKEVGRKNYKQNGQSSINLWNKENTILNLKTGNNRGNLEIEKENWNKLKKKEEKRKWGEIVTPVI